MAKVLHHKVVAALPEPLEADSIYYVRAGAGFDMYITNGAGVVAAYEINQKTSPAPISDKRTYSAVESQTVFDVSYKDGNVDVYVNGFRLAPDDYTAASGTSVSLALPCVAGDIVTLCGGDADVVAGSYSRAETDSMLAGKAAASHTHAISNVAGLEGALADKAAASHAHSMAQVTGLSAALSGKAALLATSTADGGVRMRLDGTTLYITNNGTDA